MTQYKQVIEAEKEEYNKSQYIQTGKVPHENFNINLLPNAIRNDDFILLLMPLIQNLDKANELLKESYEIWKKIKNNTDNELIVFSNYYFNTLRIDSVLIVHIMKHFMDMMIIILTKKVFGINENIDCIGKWKNLKNKPDELKVIDNYQSFIDELNEIENANKHDLESMYSAQLFRDDKLFFFAIDEKNNKTHEVEAKKIVENFNNFFQDALKLCEHYPQKS